MTARLVRQAQAGDGDAFVSLMSQYKIDMYKVAKGILGNETDVADAMSETLLLAFEHIKDVRRPEYFKTWLIRVLINVCKDMLKEKKRCGVTDHIPDRGAPDTAQENVEFLELLAVLEPKSRILMILYYGIGFNSRQIAALLGMKSSTVRTGLRRAREQLKMELERQEAGT